MGAFWIHSWARVTQGLFSGLARDILKAQRERLHRLQHLLFTPLPT